ARCPRSKTAPLAGLPLTAGSHGSVVFVVEREYWSVWPMISVRGSMVVLTCLLLAAIAGCGSGTKSASLTAADVRAAFGDQGIQPVPFSALPGASQLVSSSPPTVEVEILTSAAKAKAISAPQQVNGVEVKPIGTRNILVWVDSRASAPFQQRVSAALA